MDNKKQSRLWDREDELIMIIDRLEIALQDGKKELNKVQRELEELNQSPIELED